MEDRLTFLAMHLSDPKGVADIFPDGTKRNYLICMYPEESEQAEYP
jgi:hypothetical protein